METIPTFRPKKKIKKNKNVGLLERKKDKLHIKEIKEPIELWMHVKLDIVNHSLLTLAQYSHVYNTKCVSLSSFHARTTILHRIHENFSIIFCSFLCHTRKNIIIVYKIKKNMKQLGCTS